MTEKKATSKRTAKKTANKIEYRFVALRPLVFAGANYGIGDVMSAEHGAYAHERAQAAREVV